MDKLVSAIITTHNRCDLLIRAIGSVLSQTYKDIECIVVDDASTDGTKEYCEKCANIRYFQIPKEESRGGNYARNLGIKASHGEYCAFLDDDDYWLPEKIEKQVKLIEETDCELVHCGRRNEIVGNDGIEEEDWIPSPIFEGDMRKKILYIICTTTTNILARRQALIDVGMFDENLRFWQEYELTIRLAQRKPFYFVPEILSVYRIDKRDPKRLTNKYFEWRESVNYIHEKHKFLYRTLSLSEKLRCRILIWKDASVRCDSSGLKIRACYYKFLCAVVAQLKKYFE